MSWDCFRTWCELLHPGEVMVVYGCETFTLAGPLRGGKSQHIMLMQKIVLKVGTDSFGSQAENSSGI